MAHKKNATNMAELLLQCVTQPDPMLSMLEWLCTELMEAEVDQQLGAEKSQRTDGRSGCIPGQTAAIRAEETEKCHIFGKSAETCHNFFFFCQTLLTKRDRCATVRTKEDDAVALTASQTIIANPPKGGDAKL